MLKIKKLLIILFGLLFVALSLYSGRNTLPFKLNELLRSDNKVRIAFENYSKAFDDEHSFYIILERENILAKENSKESIKALETIHMLFRRSNIVGKLRSLNSEEFLHVNRDSVKLKPFITSKGEFSSKLKIELDKSFLKNTFVSQDGNSVLLSGNFRDFKTIKDEREGIKKFLNLLKDIEHLNPEYRFYSIGTKVAQYYYFLDTIKNQTFLTPILFLSLAILIYFLFRSMKVLFLFSFVMLISYASVIYLIAFHEGGISPYSGFAMFFILVVATSDLVHFFSIYLNSKVTDIEEKLKIVKEEVFTPCFLTTLTTAISFLSLIPNSVIPISNLGLYAAVGTFICFFLTFYFLPFLIRLFDLKADKPIELPTFKTKKLLSKVISNPKKTIFSFVVATIFFAFLGTSLTIDDNFYDKFNETHPLTVSVKKFQEKYSFLGSIDLSYTLENKSSRFLDKDIHYNILQFENEVTDIDTISYIKSFNGQYDYVRSAYQGISENKEERIEGFTSMMINYGAYSNFLNPRHKITRSIAFIKTTSSKKANELVTRIKEIANKYSNVFKVELRGFITLRNFVFNKLVKNFLISIAFSILFIFIIFIIIFKSIKWALLGMLPNLFPLILICGFLSLFNMTIDSNLVLMICITLGIAVDDTIHFLWALKRELTGGKNMLNAIELAFEKTSKALLATTLIFSLSFPAFFLADLKIFYQVGAFVILSLVFALAADFLLLPALFMTLKGKDD